MRKADAQFLIEVSVWKLTLDLAEEECPLGQLGFPLVMNKAEMHQVAFLVTFLAGKWLFRGLTCPVV